MSRSARSSDSSQALLSLMVGLLLTLYPGTVGSPHLTTPGYNTRLLQYHLLSWFSCLEGAVLGQEWGEHCQHLAKVLSIAVQSGFPVYFTQLEQVRGPSLPLLYLLPSTLSLPCFYFHFLILPLSSLSSPSLLPFLISLPPPRFLAHVKHTD